MIIRNALAGYQTGMQDRRTADAMKAETGFRNALAQYGINAPETMNAFAAVDPRGALTMNQQGEQFERSFGLREREFEAQQEIQRQQLALQRLASNRAGAAASRQAAGERRQRFGAMMAAITQLPPDQQAAAYAQAYQFAGQIGADLTGAPSPDQYTPQMGVLMASSLLGQAVTGPQPGALTPDEQRRAARIKAGLEPSADATLRSGAEPRDPIAALRARAAEAGLRPGTPEYAQFMMAGGAQSGMAIDVGPDGAISFRQGAGAAAQRPFTESQSKDNVYVTRARGALEVLDSVGADALTSFGQRAANLDPTGVVRGVMQTDQFQVAQQAGDEFLQAILRKDTGAAITAQEQALYGQTYLPQPGDNPAVLAEKARARQRAINAIEAGMSPAQMVAVERGLAAGNTPQSGALPAPPQGIDPADWPMVWDAMTPEEKALFQ